MIQNEKTKELKVLSITGHYHIAFLKDNQKYLSFEGGGRVGAPRLPHEYN